MGKHRQEIRSVWRSAEASQKSLTTVIADYVFGSDLDESHVSWLLDKIDWYQNDSSFTTDAWPSPVGRDDTPTSKLVEVKPSVLFGEDYAPQCKKKLYLESNEEAETDSLEALLFDDATFNEKRAAIAHEEKIGAGTLSPTLIVTGLCYCINLMYCYWFMLLHIVCI